MKIISRLCLLVLFLTATASAEVVRIDVDSRADVLGGRSYGLAGAYEKMSGIVHFAVDPTNPANQIIVDIEHAPTNAEGKVEFSANYTIIKPKDAERGNGTVLLGVANRGSRRLLTFFNHASAVGQRWDAIDPVTEENFGDGFLMEQGFTLLWVGWQFDVSERRVGASRAFLPKVAPAQPIEGIVRSDFVVTERIFDRILSDRNHIPYPVSDPNAPETVLTVRDTREGQRRVIPRDQWAFARLEGGEVIPDMTRIYLESGFEPHKIYETIYRSVNPEVIGLGLAGLRDAISLLKYGSPEQWNVPAGAIDRAIGFGLSQPGRALRSFLYFGFNADEQQRKVLDGIMAHIGGPARGSFNLRFGQASRDAHPYLNFYYPTDIFPFADVDQTDPVTGQTGGMLTGVPPEFMPKVFNSNSSYEYWGRVASLLTTDVDGTKDIPMMDEHARVYLFASAQHLPVPFPPTRSNGQNLNNPNDFSWMMRALLLAMNRWITDGTPAPPSVYPRIDDGTLVEPGNVNFPALPGVNFPTVPHIAYRVDYGPRFASEGIIDKEPPDMVGPPFKTLVPQTNADGNELVGLKMPSVLVPLATYTGWNLYNDDSGPTDVLSRLSGSYIPFARTREERESNGDPRPSIEERYESRAQYLGLIAQEAMTLIEDGYLLDEDLAEILELAAVQWDYHML